MGMLMNTVDAFKELREMEERFHNLCPDNCGGIFAIGEYA